MQRINRSVFADPQLLMRQHRRPSRRTCAASSYPSSSRRARGDWLVHDGDDAWRAWRRVAGARTDPRADAGARARRPRSCSAGSTPGSPISTRRGGGGAARLPRSGAPAAAAARGRRRGSARPRRRRAARDRRRARGGAARGESPTISSPASRAASRTTTPSSTTCCSAATTPSASSTSTRSCRRAWFWDVGDLLRTASTRAAEDDPHAGSRGRRSRARTRRSLAGYRAGARGRA